MLCYVDDSEAGITRRKAGRGWAYYAPDGSRITDRDEIDRLNRVGLPPAYTNAWFCPSPHGHIQAIGWDERGRKQYRYHVDFRAAQEAEKYQGCADFGRMLPRLRAQVEEDLSGRKLRRDTVIAAVIRLLDLGHVRVGNESYAKENKSFGATTLRNRHARVKGGRVRLEYRGKSGKMQRLTIEDTRLSRIVRRCQDLPGQHLFQYVDEEGEIRTVGSGDVNAYIREATGTSFTAKHFRTWGASVIAFGALVRSGGTIKLKTMLEEVSAALGNTPAIARKSYVHPALIEIARVGGGEEMAGLRLPRPMKFLSPEERGFIAFLDQLKDIAEKEIASEAA